MILLSRRLTEARNRRAKSKYRENIIAYERG